MKKYITILTIAFCLASCSDNNKTVAPSLTTDVPSINFAARQSSQIVKVDATRRWVAIPSDYWISVTPDYYPGANDHFTANVLVTAVANDEQKAREGNITFILNDDQEIIFPVTQDPKGESTLPPLPENCLMRINFDGSLEVESPYEFTASMSNGSTPQFVSGMIKQAYQGLGNDALIVTPDDRAIDVLKTMGSFTCTFWINYAFDNQSVASLFSLSNPNKEIGNIALNLESWHAEDGSFPFKAFISSESIPWDLWLDFPTIPATSKDMWTQIGLVYDGTDGRYAMYKDGVNIGQWGSEQPALQFDNVGPFVFGAFPSMVGLSSADANHWTSTGSFYTGLMDDIYFYTVAYSDDDMREQYDEQANF